MKLKLTALLAVFVCIAGLFAGCGGSYSRYQTEFYELFDTHTVVIGYARSSGEFDRYAQTIHDEMERLHRLYDIYSDYEGVNNIKTINDSAGRKAVEVDSAIIELLEFSLEAYEVTGGTVNAAMGSVLRLWHDYREAGDAIPPMEELRAAAEHIDIGCVVVDRDASTVYLTDPDMALDVGALAKGYAVEKAMQKAVAGGFTSGVISAGGNVSVSGPPLDGRDSWTVGIQDPEDETGLTDAVLVTEMAVVTSGNYQRFYTVGGEIYHHIIDPDTLMPATRYSGVTVLHPDSGIADMLSTAVFILPRPDGEALLRRYDAQAVWIEADGGVYATEGYLAWSQNFDN